MQWHDKGEREREQERERERRGERKGWERKQGPDQMSFISCAHVQECLPVARATA